MAALDAALRRTGLSGRVRRRCSSLCEALWRRSPLLAVWAFYLSIMAGAPYFFGPELLGVCLWLRNAGIVGNILFATFHSCWVACFLPELPLYIVSGFIWGFLRGFVTGLVGSAGAGVMTYHLVGCLRLRKILPSSWELLLKARY